MDPTQQKQIVQTVVNYIKMILENSTEQHIKPIDWIAEKELELWAYQSCVMVQFDSIRLKHFAYPMICSICNNPEALLRHILSLKQQMHQFILESIRNKHNSNKSNNESSASSLTSVSSAPPTFYKRNNTLPKKV